MRKSFVKFLSFLIVRLQKISNKLTSKNIDDVGYSSLSPVDYYSVENLKEDKNTKSIDNNKIIENDDYLKALLWALKNRRKENIKNIALTGPYGSGKSSILKTFQKYYQGTDLKFLEISLATFKEENPIIDEDGNEVKPKKDKLLRLIEISILEQIFYHEEDSKVPDSRFKKIKSYSKKHLFFCAIWFILFFIAVLNYFYPYFIQGIFKDYPFNNIICNLLHYGGIIIILIGFFCLIYNSIRLINSITISKLKIQNAEIGFGDNMNKSILNHHIDEILYFFSVRPYNVVIIEDLDRFRETEIFTKLREVNLLLNSSERTKNKDLVFIYAVRDEMFTDKERTKFFDFIIPIIPIINSSNSGEILLSKKNKYSYNISDRLIEDISFYIDDMRLLNNICNEYFLYKQKLNESLNQDKLFAIIIYKNIYPNDFVKLSCNEGELYDVIHSKRIFINEEIKKINASISELNDKIKNIESLSIKDIFELRKLYILKVIEHLDKYKGFQINGAEISVDSLSQDENFAYLINNNLKYIMWRRNAYNQLTTQEANVNVIFTDIQQQVHPHKSYVQRESEILDYNNDKITSLKNKIQELEKRKIKIRNCKLSDILSSDAHFNLKINGEINKNFILTLLKNGYIAEDYIDYISLFHEGSITRTDHKFIINVRNGIRCEPNYTLHKVDKIIEKLNPLEFSTELILNYDLIDFLLSKTDIYNTQVDLVFNKLKDESLESLEFIDGFIDVSENIGLFMNTLSTYWLNIWSYVNVASSYTDERKQIYFKLIVEYVSINNLIEIDSHSNLKKVILERNDFLSLIADEHKIKKIIEELNILFKNLDFSNSPDELLKFIYEYNYYEININMILSIIKKFGKLNQVLFDNSNYEAILNSECPYLIGYIEDEINIYIENIYLKIDTNINESETAYIKILNNKNLTYTNKKFAINQIVTKISVLKQIRSSELYPILLNKNRITPDWSNLLVCYEVNKEITEFMVNFINDIDNANILSKLKIPTEINSQDIYGDFCQALLEKEEIKDINYDLILNSIPWCYESIELNNFSEERVNSLINRSIINPSEAGYLLIKNYSNSLAILLIEKFKSAILKIVDKISWDSNDLNLILKSSIIANAEKKIFLNQCSNEVIASNKHNLILINQIMLDDESFVIDDSLIQTILLESQIPTINRLQLFNKYSYLITNLDEFIKSLSTRYSEIADRSKRPRFPNNIHHEKFLSILVEREYISSYSDKKGDLKVYPFRE